jgi:hypothetical protein
MDRTVPCGGTDVGSIPTESTKCELSKRKTAGQMTGCFSFRYLTVPRLTAAARRDFLRDAVFFLMMPVFAALSIAL